MRLLATIFAAVVAAGCADAGGAKASVTRQAVENIGRLSVGMSKDDVRAVMGDPARAQAADTHEAWHYCRTGSSVDEFAVVIFKDSKVTEARHYSATTADEGAVGDCSLFFHPVAF